MQLFQASKTWELLAQRGSWKWKYFSSPAKGNNKFRNTKPAKDHEDNWNENLQHLLPLLGPRSADSFSAAQEKEYMEAKDVSINSRYNFIIIATQEYR